MRGLFKSKLKNDNMSYLTKALHSKSEEIQRALDRRDISPAEALSLHIQLIRIDTVIEVGDKILERLGDIEGAIRSK